MAGPVARTEPPYLRIVNEIRARIDAGELRPGDRVPSTRRIVEEWGVAMATATKVLTTLRQQGLVLAVPGIGTVVAGSDMPPAAPPTGAAPTAAVAEAPARATTRRHTTGGTADNALTRERVVRTAIEIADAEGSTTLSMRRIAAELGVATMSLYRYVESKEELLALMMDAVFGEAELPQPGPQHWRDRLEQCARIQWSLYRRHPWVATLLSLTRPAVTPNGMTLIEWGMASFPPVDPRTVMHVSVTTVSYVRGVAVGLETEAEAQRATGITGQEWMRDMDPVFTEVVSSGAYPMYASFIDLPDDALDLDSLFEFGLERLLDGIEVLLSRTGAGSGEGAAAGSGGTRAYGSAGSGPDGSVG
ncbi:TetR/AcrR family transcriptional regulator C-terminal domain-containing protein [Allostreptomyces psammosilenae]|uniref:DNA-binding transcriptional regulator YhcF (GntR family)/AcrR family transcriptional regulator n=1 Tax=Allostreptomyces psammosilenae TaxID=1892865 RepID=A0A853A430_9ACTN|nr:TetR/AcrR family transcriptional regulator C-terminal domain-containing protein [Allostreptomyces psammosilenae]NYI05461.1 DNA-binding transcriptional regulator YhcF (GntR family)/AcrR family transcriptional regulator [Allostreptomyces psammosilenae]